jgi:hypothetical protein
MEFFIAIAMLCQVGSADKGNLLKDPYRFTDSKQLECQQSYIHCVNVNSSVLKDRHVVLERCILERKI